MKLPSLLNDGGVSVGVVIGLYASTVSSAIVSYSTGDSEDIRFQWAVPEVSANSGSGNVYFQLEAPDSYAWVGLGIGQRMNGAQIFLMYQDGNGGVTLSTREGTGHVMPQYTERSDVELIEGSEVANGTMRANVRCSGCDSLDLSSSNGWITAWNTGDPMDTTSTEAQITVHDMVNIFQVDFSEATVSEDSNPFLSDDTTSDDSSNDSGDEGSAVQESSGDNSATIELAHGVVMTIAFVGLYPLGSSLMILLGKWYIHAAWQAVAYLLMWAGFALGYWYANNDNMFFDNFHTGAGTIIVALLGIQPVFGWVHHTQFRKVGKRGIFSHIHVWYGRILIIFGIVNGGLGLQLAGKTSGAWLIAYCVVSAIVVPFYISTAVFGFFRRRQDAKAKSVDGMSETRAASDS